MHNQNIYKTQLYIILGNHENTLQRLSSFFQFKSLLTPTPNTSEGYDAPHDATATEEFETYRSPTFKSQQVGISPTI